MAWLILPLHVGSIASDAAPAARWARASGEGGSVSRPGALRRSASSGTFARSTAGHPGEPLHAAHHSRAAPRSMTMRYGFYLPTRVPSATPEALEKLPQRGEAPGFDPVMIAYNVTCP